jgi:hypothetical protein
MSGRGSDALIQSARSFQVGKPNTTLAGDSSVIISSVLFREALQHSRFSGEPGRCCRSMARPLSLLSRRAGSCGENARICSLAVFPASRAWRSWMFPDAAPQQSCSRCCPGEPGVAGLEARTGKDLDRPLAVVPASRVSRGSPWMKSGASPTPLAVFPASRVLGDQYACTAPTLSLVSRRAGCCGTGHRRRSRCFPASRGCQIARGARPYARRLQRQIAHKPLQSPRERVISFMPSSG